MNSGGASAGTGAGNAGGGRTLDRDDGGEIAGAARGRVAKRREPRMLERRVTRLGARGRACAREGRDTAPRARRGTGRGGSERVGTTSRTRGETRVRWSSPPPASNTATDTSPPAASAPSAAVRRPRPTAPSATANLARARQGGERRSRSRPPGSLGETSTRLRSTDPRGLSSQADGGAAKMLAGAGVWSAAAGWWKGLGIVAPMDARLPKLAPFAVALANASLRGSRGGLSPRVGKLGSRSTEALNSGLYPTVAPRRLAANCSASNCASTGVVAHNAATSAGTPSPLRLS
jgi:hypothetical protein